MRHRQRFRAGGALSPPGDDAASGHQGLVGGCAPTPPHPTCSPAGPCRPDHDPAPAGPVPGHGRRPPAARRPAPPPHEAGGGPTLSAARCRCGRPAPGPPPPGAGRGPPGNRRRPPEAATYLLATATSCGLPAAAGVLLLGWRTSPTPPRSRGRRPHRAAARPIPPAAQSSTARDPCKDLPPVEADGIGQARWPRGA